MQHWQEETECQQALQEQTVLDKDSQLAGVQAELDSCQARVSLHLLTALLGVDSVLEC